MTVRNSSGVKLPTSSYSYTIDPSTYNASISFGTTLTGSVALQGCFSATTASTDFQAVASGAGEIIVCGSCTSTAYADREYVTSGSYIKWVVGTQPWTLLALNNGVSGTAYIYMDAVTLRFMVAQSSATAGVSIQSGSSAEYVYSATGYPSTAVPIATVTYDGAGNFGTITDTRAFQN